MNIKLLLIHLLGVAKMRLIILTAVSLILLTLIGCEPMITYIVDGALEWPQFNNYDVTFEGFYMCEDEIVVIHGEGFAVVQFTIIESKDAIFFIGYVYRTTNGVSMVLAFYLPINSDELQQEHEISVKIFDTRVPNYYGKIEVVSVAVARFDWYSYF